MVKFFYYIDSQHIFFRSGNKELKCNINTHYNPSKNMKITGKCKEEKTWRKGIRARSKDILTRVNDHSRDTFNSFGSGGSLPTDNIYKITNSKQTLEH